MTTTLLLIFCGTILGFAAGYVMHRSDFCLAGMFRDLFLFKSAFKMRFLLLLIFISMLLFEISRLSGLLDNNAFPLFSSPSLTALLGGTLFGIGMVLSGGCVVGSLYKAGSGSAPSLAALAGLIGGSAIFAEIFPWWKTVTRTAGFSSGNVTLADALGINPSILVLLAATVILPYIINIFRRGGWSRPCHAEGSLQPWLAAIFLALIGFGSIIVTDMPMGITTSYAKMAAIAENAMFPEHYSNLEFFRTMPLKYTTRLTDTFLCGGPGSSMDGIALVQFPLIFGIVTGSGFSALLLGELTFRWRAPLRQYLSAAAGGILMGLASRMSAGCNVWHLLGGLPIMALQSILFVAGLLPGAWLGSILLTRYVIR